MNRLKFRVWDIGKKSYLYTGIFMTLEASLFRMLPTGQMCDHGCHAEYMDFCSEDNYIIEQWTGLKDSKDVDIYEGNIISWDDASGGKYWRVAEVVWDKGGWCFRIIPGKSINCYPNNETWDFHMGNFIYCPNTSEHGNVMEVIGNIHEEAKRASRRLRIKKEDER